MWANVNTKPTKGKIFRIIRGGVVCVPTEYDDGVESRRAQLLLMTKIESERIPVADGKILEKVAVVAPARPTMAKNKKEFDGVAQTSRFHRE